MELSFTKCHGSGNDFALLNSRGIELDDASWGRIARTLCDRDGPVGADGVLLLTQGDESFEFGMRVVNADGSEPETCLNGLRCLARAGFEAFGIDAALVRLKTSGAEVAREAELAPGVYTVRETVGPVGTDPTAVGIRVAGSVVEAVIPGLPSDRAFTALAMPNPHLIAFVDDVDEGELVALGDWCEAAPPLIPGRANISFVAPGGDGALFVRTYERGVGLTDSCGSAMAASIHAAALTGRIAWDSDIVVRNRGGLVRGRTDRRPGVEIAGNATFEYRAAVTFDPDEGLGAVERLADFPAERTAWQGVLDAARG